MNDFHLARIGHPERKSIVDIRYPASYVVWDLETTDLSPERGEILEIGCIEVEGGEIVKSHQWLIKQPAPLSEKTTELTGITDAMVEAEGKDKAYVFQEFMSILNHESGRPHVTHNGFRFDIPWLTYHLIKTFAIHPEQGVMLTEKLFNSMIDTAVFVKAQKLNMPRQYHESMQEWAQRVMNVMAKGVKYSIATCIEEMNLQLEAEQHRAGGDVLFTNEIYKNIVWPKHMTTTSH